MRLQTLTIQDFSFGQVSKDSEFLIPDNALALCKNGIVGREGIKKRGGYEKWNSTAIGGGTDKVTSIIRFTVSSGTKYFLAFCGTDIYKADLTNKTFSSIKSGITADLLWDFAAYNDKLYMSNGTDNFMSFDGTTVTEHSTLPKGKYLVVLKDRLWVAGVSSSPYRLYYSDVGDPETFGANNYIDFPESPHGYEGVITGLGIFGNDVVVFKEKATYMVIERVPGSFSVIQIDALKGCIAHHSICNVPGGLFFLSGDGVYLFTGSQLRFVGEPIRDYTDNRATAQITKAVSAFYDNCYYLSFPKSGSTDNDITVVFNTLGGWSVFEYGFHYFSVWEDKTIYGAGDNGYVYQLDKGKTDDGNSIIFKVKTKSYGDEVYKVFRQCSIDALATAGIMSINAIIDGGKYTQSRSVNLTPVNAYLVGDASSTVGTAQVAGEYAYHRIPLAVVGKRVQLDLESSSDEDIILKAITLKFREKRRK